MVFSLLKRKHKKAPSTSSINATYEALIAGLNEMERQGVDRITLQLYELEKSPNTHNLVRHTEFAYYPLEILEEPEQEMIRGKRNYRVISLVTDNVGDTKGDIRGVEDYQRSHFIPFLPSKNDTL